MFGSKRYCNPEGHSVQNYLDSMWSDLYELMGNEWSCLEVVEINRHGLQMQDFSTLINQFAMESAIQQHENDFRQTVLSYPLEPVLHQCIYQDLAAGCTKVKFFRVCQKESILNQAKNHQNNYWPEHEVDSLIRELD